MEALLPSEIARLVWGKYAETMLNQRLQQQKYGTSTYLLHTLTLGIFFTGYLQKECPSAGHVFLKNSPALAEFREAKRLGRRALDTVNGHTLTDLLSDVSDTYNLG
jgi:hypothetical protein